MIPYSIHVGILLAVCLLFYKLLLQKETYYRLNRVILLTCLVLAFLLPLVPVPQQFSLRSEPPVFKPVVAQPTFYNGNLPNEEVENVPAQAKPVVNIKPTTNAKPVVITPQQTIAQVTKPQTIIATAKKAIPSVPVMQQLLKWAFWLYWCGVAAFGANLLLQVIVLLYQAYKKPVMKDGIYRIVELDDDKAPCSFGNNIFINPAKYDWETYNQILMHEKVHIQQGHSLDLIIAELMLVVQWFNPFAWLYRRELESNLEFLTDDSVLYDHQVPAEDYQLSLLKVSVPNFSMRITTNYNQSLLKKRIIMMNSKKSNFHTMWKYFILMPLLVVLVCGLNKPVAMSSPLAKFQQMAKSIINNRTPIDFSHGTWYATIKTDKVYVEFQADENDEHHSWSSSHNFMLTDFPNLPKTEKADFTLTREAGTVVFNGRFDGDQGIGHYKFTPNKDYAAYMAKQNIGGTDDDEYFSFFMSDVKKEYVQFLQDNGFKDIQKYQIMSMSSQKIDAAYIKLWKDLGYTNLTTNQLVSLKSQKIDADYVNDIKKAGYTDLTIQQLISFHSQHITGDYINGLKKANVSLPGANADQKLTPQQIVTSKARNVDSAYVTGITRAGLTASSVNSVYSGQGNQVYFSNNSQYNQIGTLKSLDVTPEFIKGFEVIGFKDLSPNTLIILKRDEITPEYVKGFKDLGYNDQDIVRLIQLKRQGITPEYVKGFANVGYSTIPVNSLSRLASQKITPTDIKAYMDLGFKVDMVDNRFTLSSSVAKSIGGTGNISTSVVRPKDEVVNGISINTVAAFKEQGITPDYVKSFQATGYKFITANNIRIFKAEGITPENIKAMQNLGYNDIPVNAIKLITPEYIKSFQDIGYKNVTLDQYANLKRQGITADFVAGFNKLGFTNIPLNQLSYLKNSGITPEFVSDMKQKGFDSKDLQKYIQLKNFNQASANGVRTINATQVEKNNK